MSIPVMQMGGFDMIGLPYYGAFDFQLCQISTIAPYMPEGEVVEQYIDRCITACKITNITRHKH